MLLCLGEMTVEELMKQYSGEYDSDFEAELAAMSGDDDGTPDDTEDEDEEEDTEGGCCSSLCKIASLTLRVASVRIARENQGYFRGSIKCDVALFFVPEIWGVSQPSPPPVSTIPFLVLSLTTFPLSHPISVVVFCVVYL